MFGHAWIVPCLLGLAVAQGCSQNASAPATYPVTGVVTQNGDPIAGALVQFHPRREDFSPLPEGADAVGAQATTDGEGRYSVESTFDQGKTSTAGLPAGAYAVTVTKVEMPSGGPSRENPPRNVLDAKFAKVDSTPVKVTIKADGENVVDVAL
jgi:hypothetical protein